MKNADVLLLGCSLAFILGLLEAIQRGRRGDPDLSAWGLMILAVAVLWVGR